MRANFHAEADHHLHGRRICAPRSVPRSKSGLHTISYHSRFRSPPTSVAAGCYSSTVTGWSPAVSPTFTTAAKPEAISPELCDSGKEVDEFSHFSKQMLVAPIVDPDKGAAPGRTSSSNTFDGKPFSEGRREGLLGSRRPFVAFRKAGCSRRAACVPAPAMNRWWRQADLRRRPGRGLAYRARQTGIRTRTC